MTRAINAAGLDLIKRFEGCRLEAYVCPAGIPSIGFGHTRDVVLGQCITEADAEQLLREDLARAQFDVERLVEVPLTDNQYAACVSLCYNIGPSQFALSTALHLINNGKFEGVPGAIQLFNKARVGGVKTPLEGLTRRRAAEAELWSTP